MKREVIVGSRPAPIAGALAFALGAAAVGAIAIGALAIGRLAIDRVVVKRARFNQLEVDELTVRKLHVVENSGDTLSATYKPPGVRGRRRRAAKRLGPISVG